MIKTFTLSIKRFALLVFFIVFSTSMGALQKLQTGNNYIRKAEPKAQLNKQEPKKNQTSNASRSSSKAANYDAHRAAALKGKYPEEFHTNNEDDGEPIINQTPTLNQALKGIQQG